MLSTLVQSLKQPYLAGLATLIVCILLFLPSKDLNLPETLPLFDKGAHFLIFGGLGFLWTMYLSGIIRPLFYLIAYALFTEIVQYLLPDSFQRGFELLDLGADSIGIIFGITLAYLIEKCIKPLHR